MGRYYNTDSGRDGKFIFGVQPSDDPSVIGMIEEGASYINYYASKDDVENIKSNLDKQYDILGIDKKDRIYEMPKDGDRPEWEVYADYEKKYLHDRVWETFQSEDNEAIEKKYGENPVRWGGDDIKHVDIERDGGLVLALGRIRLALTVLTDIKENGYCSLEAEL